MVASESSYYVLYIAALSRCDSDACVAFAGHPSYLNAAEVAVARTLSQFHPLIPGYRVNIQWCIENVSCESDRDNTGTGIARIAPGQQARSLYHALHAVVMDCSTSCHCEYVPVPLTRDGRSSRSTQPCSVRMDPGLGPDGLGRSSGRGPLFRPGTTYLSSWRAALNQGPPTKAPVPLPVSTSAVCACQ
jgi:hypothetical protein